MKTLRSLSFSLVALCAALTPAFAADWTDANNVTYTALKTLKGNGDGVIITDIVPTSSDIVKFRFMPVTTIENNTYECFYCTRASNNANTFSSFREGGRIRLDRGQTASKTLCNTTALTLSNEFAVVANYGTAQAWINNTSQSLGANWGTGTYTPAGPLVMFAAHTDGASVNADSVFAFPGSFHLFYFGLYDPDGNLKHCLLPAQRDSDSVYGLYDTKTGKFYAQIHTAFSDSTARTVTVTDTCKKWTGCGSDNRMSTGANWEGGVAPGNGDNLDFTLAAPLAEINADILGVTFGKLWIDDGDIPDFTGSMVVSAVNIPANVAGNAAITIEASGYTWNGGAAANWGDANVWTFEGVATTWSDGYAAIFATTNATATLAADVAADQVDFRADATIAAGGGTLWSPVVNVINGVTATIAAPTVGALAKAGAGTLVVANRAATTTLTGGTLVISDGATLDWSNFTFGASGGSPVTLAFEPGAALASMPANWYVGQVPSATVTLRKTGGDWSVSENMAIGRSDSAVATFVHEGGTLNVGSWFSIGGVGANLSTLVVSGGVVTNSYTSSSETRFLIGGTTTGVAVVVTNGVLGSAQGLAVGSDGNGTLTVADGGKVTVGENLVFGWASMAGSGTVNLESGGTIELGGKVTKRNGSGVFYFNGGTLKAGAEGTLVDSQSGFSMEVKANGGVIDNGGYNVTIAKGITGAGGLTLEGDGRTTFSADQGYAGATTVKGGTTLSAIGRTFAGPVVFEAGAGVSVPDIPEGDEFAEVMTAVSFAGVELITPPSGRRLFAIGSQLYVAYDGGTHDYTRVEYIQGDGSTGYLVADFSPGPSNDTIVAEAMLTSNANAQFLFVSAAMNVSDTTPKQGVLLRNEGIRFDYIGNGTACYKDELAATVGKRITYTVTRGRMTWTGGTPIENSDPAPASWSGPLQILGSKYNGAATFCSSIKLYSLKVYRNSKLIHDFVPVVDEQENPTLLDVCGNTVVMSYGTLYAGPVVWLEVADIPVQSYRSGQACEPHPTVVDIESGATLSEGTDYTLSWSDNDCVGKGTVTITGTGSFDGKSQTATFSIVPRLPAGYKPVEYAHSSGEQFIDTGFTPNEKTRADIRFLMHSNGSYSSPFGARNASEKQFFVSGSCSANYYFCRHDAGATDLSGKDGYVGAGALVGKPSVVGYHKFSLNRNVFNLDEYAYNFSSSVIFSCDRSAYAFATHGADGIQHPAIMELYSLKIWDDGVLVRDFVPCVKVEGGVETVGLYDVSRNATKRFYENGGSGAALVAGPELPELPTGFIVILK